MDSASMLICYFIINKKNKKNKIKSLIRLGLIPRTKAAKPTWTYNPTLARHAL